MATGLAFILPQINNYLSAGRLASEQALIALARYPAPIKKMNIVKVIVVDDHRLIREMWSELFNLTAYITVIGECGTFDEAISMITDKRPDIVLLDINLSRDSGFDAVPLIRKNAPGTKIIAVSMHNQPSYAKKMFGLGARGYMTKNSSQEEIIKAVDEVMAGRIYLCNEVKNIVAEQLLPADVEEPDIKSLSVREMEIVRLMKEGISSKDIASKLFISVRTVEVHRHNILKKFKFKNTASLVNFINNSDFNFN